MASSFSALSDSLLPPYEIVFSCSLCQKTISDLYPQIGTDKKINEGSGGAERVAKKLWMTECAHVICGEHLEGGGVPFHPGDERPKAACPVCMLEGRDPNYTKLFAIVGARPGEHDTAIPPEYFDTPPEKSLTDDSQSTRALKFQYMAILRYGRMMRKRLEDARQSLAAADERTGGFFNKAQSLKEERNAFQSRIKSLEATETKFKAYKTREPEVKHYLERFAGIAKENAILKEQLAALGYEVPRTVWSMDKPPPKRRAIPFNQSHVSSSGQSQPVKAVDSNTLSQHAQDRHSHMQHQSSGSSRKRPHKEYLEGLIDGDREDFMDAPAQLGHRNKESMLPPPLPLQRASKRPALTRRDQFESVSSQGYQESSRTPQVRPRLDAPDVQVYQNGAWSGERNQEPLVLRPARPYQSLEPPFMSGAIGPAPARHDLNGYRMDFKSVQSTPQSRFTKPPELSMEDTHFRQPFSQPRSHLSRLKNLNEPARYLQTPAARQLPSRAASRSSFLRQSLIPTIPRNVRGPDSGYYSNGELYNTSRYTTMDEDLDPATCQQNVCLSQPAIESSFFKPHFRGLIPEQEHPKYQKSDTGQSEQLVSGLQHLQMEPASQPPRIRPSLNALSFIDEPYTATNQPIYAKQRRPLSYSQDEQPYRPAAISRAGFVQDPRVKLQSRRQPNSIRLPSIMPSSSQPLAHAKTGARNGGSMIRPIGGSAARPSANSFPPGVGHFPWNDGGPVSSRGIFSATGRRCVRR